MIQSVEHLHEQSMKIALDFLARSGELQDTNDAVHIVGSHIARLIGSGEMRTLKLSNLAIDSYLRQRNDAPLQLVK